MATQSPDYLEEVKRAAKAIKHASVLVVTAGAGMGVDSGLPDFRGPEGFWRAYPPLKQKGIVLQDMSTPQWFQTDPEFAWGFFGHRYNLYSNTQPHDGFQILKKWGLSMKMGYFVFTSNVDGHFQKAGFPHDKVMEVHGSINFMQCADDSVSEEIWPVPEGSSYEVDISTLTLKSPLPMGPPMEHTHLARPNILMFGDSSWVSNRTFEQQKRFNSFLTSVESLPIVVVEVGAGLAVPTVRCTSEAVAQQNDGMLIRINPNEPQVSHGHISLPVKGLQALSDIDKFL